jgi:hypothetical protein
LEIVVNLIIFLLESFFNHLKSNLNIFTQGNFLQSTSSAPLGIPLSNATRQQNGGTQNNNTTQQEDTQSDIEAGNTETSPLLSSSLVLPIATMLNTSAVANPAPSGLARRHMQQQHAMELAERIAADDTTSDASDRISEDSYLLAIRWIAFYESIVHVYRCTLPIPLWTGYLIGTSTGGMRIFALAYLLIKFTDLLWKASALFKGMEQIIFSKLEYGHYSTEEECAANTANDCPICYETPRKPVTLRCQHIFCEVCITEWLDREKTCPICRIQIESESAAYAKLKRKARSSGNIFL